MNTFFFDDVQYPEGLFGGKDFFNPIIYSTEEREVGVWTNGKPLYQKTFERNLTLPSATWVVTGDSIPNGQVVKSEATKIDSISDSILTWGEIGSDGHIELINIRPVGSVTISHYTMWYTKTTDVAGSAQYTTLGVPAHHYDGEEKIIGTWFGETLYEKTINTTVAPPYSSIDLSSLNINEVVGFEGCSKSSGGDSIPVGYSVASGNQYLVVSFEKATSTLYISLGSGLSAYNNVFLTIRYTKTS